MKRTHILAAFLGVVSLFLTSCGTSDYLESLTITGTGGTSGGMYNLAGVDGTIQLTVSANYHSGKTVNVTNTSTFTVTPVCCTDGGAALPPYGPNTVPISPTGLMTGIVPICTWTDVIETTGTPPNTTTAPANPPVWEYTGYYQVVASYRNFTSQPVGIGVGVAASLNSPIGGCGPS